jgi:hypothetical protein
MEVILKAMHGILCGLVVLSIPVVAAAQSTPQGGVTPADQVTPTDDQGRPHTPSPERIAACKDKAEGATCEFEGKRGHVEGACKKIRTGDLVCKRPHRPRT